MNNQQYQQPYQQQPYQQQPYQQQPYQQPAYNNYNQTPMIPDEYKPISMWGYLGYTLLFCIPVIGFILLIVFCFAPANVNVKNFARSYFCLFIVAAIVLLIVGLATGGLAYITAMRG